MLLQTPISNISFLLILFLFSGCDLGYYSQAVSGHFDILDRKQKIEDLLNNPNTPPELVQKLKLNQNVRRFAQEELMLPRSKSYTEYADIGRSYVSTLVTASEPLQLKPYRWWYLVIGYAEYRGYYDPEEAKAYAKLMEEDGWDVALGKARAYSTLGLNSRWVPDYFKDPVLNTFLDRSTTRIISLLIHEMAHQVVYISGDTAFNESFAVFVEQEGLRRYLKANYEDHEKLFVTYQNRQKDRERFRHILQTAHAQLEELYTSDQTDEIKRQTKQRIFEEMKQSYAQQKDLFLVLDYSNWFDRPLNNAHLLGVRRYSGYVDAFERLFKKVGEDWNAFYDEVKRLASLSEAERTAELTGEKSLSNKDG